MKSKRHDTRVPAEEVHTAVRRTRKKDPLPTATAATITVPMVNQQVRRCHFARIPEFILVNGKCINEKNEAKRRHRERKRDKREKEGIDTGWE